MLLRELNDFSSQLSLQSVNHSAYSISLDINSRFLPFSPLLLFLSSILLHLSSSVENMHEMDTKVEATCPNNWDDSYVANPDTIKEEGFDEAIKSEPELEETDLHDYPLAIKDESFEHSDGIESEVEVINPYTIKDECDSVALKSESELEGNNLDDDPTTIKCETVELTDEAGSEIGAISSYGEQDEGGVSLELAKEESCEEQYEASVKSEDIDSPTEYDSDLANSISVKEEATQNVSVADLHSTEETFCADKLGQ